MLVILKSACNLLASCIRITCFKSYLHATCCIKLSRNLAILLLISELTNLEDLVKHLQVTYQKVVEGEGSALIGAKSIVTTAVHYYRNHGQLDVPVGLSAFLAKLNFI